MGRKIPGRKHRGVRDPEKQRQQRLEKIKDKINAPPLNTDEQAIPKSLTRLMELKDKAKSVVEKIKKKSRNGKPAPLSSHPKHYKPNPQIVGKSDGKERMFRQRGNETVKEFLKRIDRACRNVIQETKFEVKYGVKIKKNKDGEMEVTKAKKDDLEVYYDKVRKEGKLKKKGKKKKKANEEEKLTKTEKRKLKLKAKKQNNLLRDVDEFKAYEDEVKFGEIVHEPPKLVKPKKVAHEVGASRPGKKNLLLKSMLGDKEPLLSPKIKNSKSMLHKTLNNVINKKGKRKDLPNALRRQLDKQQEEVIQAYKDLKKKKYINK